MALADRETNVKSRDTAIGTTKRESRLPLISLVLGILAFTGMMISIWAIFLYAPTDAVQGDAQRIFYIHVPMAWLAMVAFGVRSGEHGGRGMHA